nr:hypothetical protein [Tanacetum cinerariifolium]
MAPRSQDRGRRDNYRQGSKVDEQTPKALMAIDGVGWDWSFIANEQEDHALVADEEDPRKFALMAKTSAESEVFDNSLCSKNCKKNTDSLNSILEFADDTVTDYSRPSPAIESTFDDAQNRNPSIPETKASLSTISSKPFIKFVKVADPPTVAKSDKKETVMKHSVKYAKQYRKPTKRVDHGSSWGKNNNTHKNKLPRTIFHKTGKPPMRTNRPYMNAAQSKRTYFYKPAHSYTKRTFQRTSIVRSQFRGPRVTTVNRKFPTVNRKLPTVNRKFPTGNTKFSTTDLGGCKITGKGTIKTGKLEFENVYFVKDLKYNLFSVSQICDNKNSVLFTDSECIVLGRDFKLIDDTNALLKTPRQHNMYSIDLNNIVPHKDLTCLVAKASTDECMLWHRRLGHLNFKTMNKLVRHNLVRGLPTKCFENDHSCTACLKGKQHKASFVTDDFSKFTWTFFLKTKDETSGILRKFITEIENLKDLKVKIIRCDNGGEFRNKEMNDFCSRKGIKREISNARTPQQNGVAEKRNRTLIEAARIMVLVNKSQNKTPYELFNGRTSAIGFLKPFGCHVMILNTLDNLGKFEAKGDEGYFIGYSMSNKAFRVFNKRTKRVEENLHVDFLENKVMRKVHDALLESTLSNAQDTCKADAPESSGNPNPNVSITNPPADQIETLTMETSIPTVSSPVSTACFTDSQEPSSDTRLISKRVTNQEETPSLDNILTLTNMYEDIIGGTTNTDDSNAVEADVSNMETTITSSPTPILRIHKDHLKSQIISPVDTLIQTRYKSKEAIRLFLAYASFMRFTVYQMDVKSAFLYGATDEEVHQVTPKECHMHAVKRIFRYLKSHPKLRLWYPKESPFDLIAYSDSGYGEYVAAASCCRQVLWIQNQMLDYGLSMPCEALSKEISSSILLFLRLIPLNTDFHPIVDFVGASHIRYALTFNPTIHVSHIRQFWSTARIETTEEGTKILATVDGKLRTVSESSIRRNLKLNDKAGISSLPDAELFENLQLMGYNILPNQKFTFQKGQFSHQWKYIIHTIIQCLNPKSTGFNEFSRNIATALVCLATNRVYNFSKMIFDGMVRNVNNKVFKFLMYPRFLSKCLKMGQFGQIPHTQTYVVPFHTRKKFTTLRVNSPSFSGRIIPLFVSVLVPQGEGSGTPTESHHTPTSKASQSSQHQLPSPSLPPVSTESLPTVIPSDNPPPQALHYKELGLLNQDMANMAKTSTLPSDSTPRVTFLAADEGIQELEINSLKARIKLLEDKNGGVAEQFGDDAPIKGKRLDEGEEAAKRVKVATATVSIPTGTGVVLTASPTIPTAALIFTTATESTPYTRRKGKEKMVESETPKKKKVQFA